MYKGFGDLPQEDSALFLERAGINSSELRASYEKYPALLPDEDFLRDFCEHVKNFATAAVNKTDDAELLRTIYEENFSKFVNRLIDAYEFETAEDIVNDFRDKVVNLAGKASVPCAYFDGKLFYVLDAQGKYEAAKDYAWLSWKKYFKLRGKKHPDTIDALMKISVALSNFENYEDALDVDKTILEFSEEIFGENHPRTFAAMENIAETWNNIGNCKRALELEEKVLQFRRKNLGEENPLTITSMSSMANILSNFESRLDEALALKEKVVEFRRKNFGANNPATISAMSDLGVILSKMNRHAEAVPWLEEVFNVNEEFLGEKHPHTTAAMNNLANALFGSGREKESIELTERALKLRNESSSKEDFGCYESIALAVRLSSTGRLEDAITLWKRIIESIFESDEGGDIRDYIDSVFDATNETDLRGGLQILFVMTFLAEDLLSAGKNDEALSWADHALKLGEKVLSAHAKIDDEFYDGVDFYKSLNGLREWHGDFFKKLRGEYVEPVNAGKNNVRTHATRAIPLAIL